MIDLCHLAYVLAAAEQRSFSQAAGRFNVKQSTLSRKVARLEDQLGFRLFERTTRGARPTPHARLFLAEARELLDRVGRLEHTASEFRRAARPRLSLGYTGDLFSGAGSQAICAFLSRYPDVCLEGHERTPETLFAVLEANHADAVIAPAGHKDQRWASHAFPQPLEEREGIEPLDVIHALYWWPGNTNPLLGCLRSIVADGPGICGSKKSARAVP
ncbi:LysR family transcriptional regulator [Blastomonas sp.]|uniref:LysR family transcriptional regulator n=1 Tax=Blastomonas sp. TaxID=1909299 RepID=UPI00406A5695